MSRINNTVVADLMTADVMVVGVQTAIAEVRVELTGSGLHALPVVDGGDIVGVVTLADCQDKVGNQTVADVVGVPPVTIAATAPITEAATLMRVEHVHHLPVTDGAAQLVGILSSFDLLDLLVDP